MSQNSQLVVKHARRVEEVRTPSESRPVIRLRTTLGSRLVRRDFHLMSTKMRACAHQSGYRQTVRDDLSLFELEVARFVRMSRQIRDVPSSVFVAEVQLRLVCAESARLFHAMKAFDSALSCLLVALMDGKIDVETGLQPMLRPVLFAYKMLKQSSLKMREQRTAAQLAAELGVD